MQIKSDYDKGDFSIKYLLSGEGAGEVFIIDEYSGEIYILHKLDREEKAFYILRSQAINRKTNQPVEPESEFIIKVQDINDNMPQFQNEPYVSVIPEMSPSGMYIYFMCKYNYGTYATLVDVQFIACSISITNRLPHILGVLMVGLEGKSTVNLSDSKGYCYQVLLQGTCTIVIVNIVMQMLPI